MSAKKNQNKNPKDEMELDEKETVVDLSEAEPEIAVEDEALTKAEEEIASLKDQLLRQRAEFDNFRKRTAKEKTDIYVDVKADCVAQLLPMIDNFDRAMDTPCKDETFKKGMEMIQQQFLQALQSMGLEEIEALGQEFDPQVHHAVSRMEKEGFEDNTVCEVFQKGYKLGEKIVRPAMVVVAQA